MTCDQVRTLLNSTERCCASCHVEAGEGYGHSLEFGSEPCCVLIMLACDSGIDPFEEVKDVC